MHPFAFAKLTQHCGMGIWSRKNPGLWGTEGGRICDFENPGPRGWGFELSWGTPNTIYESLM